jgi:hypothetical protein
MKKDTRTIDEKNIDIIGDHLWASVTPLRWMDDPSYPSKIRVCRWLKKYAIDPDSFVMDVIGNVYNGEAKSPEVVLQVRDYLELKTCTCKVQGTFYGWDACPSCEETMRVEAGAREDYLRGEHE